jgi:hypothetical protein
VHSSKDDEKEGIFMIRRVRFASLLCRLVSGADVVGHLIFGI